MKKMKKIDYFVTFIAILLLPIALFALFDLLKDSSSDALPKNELSKDITPEHVYQTARIMANGDLLYHDLLYMSAEQADGTYRFDNNYHYVKPWLEQADLAIADYEGTIRPDYPLSGYPLFNAPVEVAKAVADAGYDVVSLAQNHILDSELKGIETTVDAFEQVGITSIGVFTKQPRETAPITVKNINGIRVALLSYSYGFNGLESQLTQEEYQHYLADLNIEKIQKDIERAEKEADFTLVMPHMGVEYMLEPTVEQKQLYHQMIEWGADAILGGHPHVVQPSEIIEKNGEKKLIIYSMGNFISNQRMETLDNKWTERGILVDLLLEKVQGKTSIKRVAIEPTWVDREPLGSVSKEGYPLYDYKTFILSDFIEGGKYRHLLPYDKQQRIDEAYRDMLDHVKLQWQ